MEAVLQQAAFRLALWCLPPRHWIQKVGQASTPAACLQTRPALSQLIWAVNAATSVIPRSTCLVRALAAQRLLARHGYPSTLYLGVARTSEGLDAHAWLDHNGTTLIGAADPGHYAPLAAPGPLPGAATLGTHL